MEYVVQPGDTLSAIARRFGVSLAALLAVNPEIADPDLIFPGQLIRIPLLLPVRPPVGRCLYVVQPGDTMAEIARRFCLDLTTLVNANPQIANPDLIFPGQVIYIPRCRRPEMPPEMPVDLEHLEMPMAMPKEAGLLPEFCPPEPPERELEELPRPQQRPVPPEYRPYHRR
ncbi:MAG: LysM peptidoglycan-binding domain-containing protein [Bacillota bacterium]|nr:LysM peptidoglycan-binding domain-containing protein [Bacillota bacterium]